MQGVEKALVGQTNKACENKVFKACGYSLYIQSTYITIYFVENIWICYVLLNHSINSKRHSLSWS